MKRRTLMPVMIALMGIAVLTSCEKEDEQMTDPSQMTIAEYASYDSNFSILVSALSKAGLVSTLNGAGNFTVFAPTNAAFNALFTDLGVSGIADIPVETLTPILLYHVLGEEKKSNMITTGYYSSLSTSQSNNVTMRIDAGMEVKINNSAKVIVADVDVTNGVIHAIDKVILPPTVVDIAIANPAFSILVEAVVKADLVETLNGDGPFTIFAPTNTAFEALFTSLGVTGIADLSAEALTPILLYHVVSGNVTSSQLTAGAVPTLNGNIDVELSPAPAINGVSNIVLTDVQGTNGIVHVIDKVLVPSK
ncbi:MAG: fasciclin domain-containing protein [Bacteroidales bacterium]|nr:fasciclin domain-containing protein [Bacteroidales bacterium]